MGHSQIPICRYNFRHLFAVSFLILLISTLEGRILSPTADNKKVVINEEKLSILRPQIGSRPPRCEGRCSSCFHCVAIQVPSNPQSTSKINNSAQLISASTRDDYHSNYKPMSWKCKCGDLIFNP
ncbi:EPIDERMAL PATTERNING FACTOR-like protein 2 [Henckelia pumila]|uniref:EPIDERMAL PATTERNING FACTOR-like protein 2 n=1 Tax=Henckelia pumila TaxID=405737 RepID=UPI003C6E1C41